jgi:hypothetical protein
MVLNQDNYKNSSLSAVRFHCEQWFLTLATWMISSTEPWKPVKSVRTSLFNRPIRANSMSNVDVAMALSQVTHSSISLVCSLRFFCTLRRKCMRAARMAATMAMSSHSGTCIQGRPYLATVIGVQLGSSRLEGADQNASWSWRWTSHRVRYSVSRHSFDGLEHACR